MQNITLNCSCFFSNTNQKFPAGVFSPRRPRRSPFILHSAFLHSAFYHASSPFTSGSTSFSAVMPTSIMESSGSKVVKF